MKPTEHKATVYDIVTERMIALLEKGVCPWHKPWAGGPASAPKNLVSGKAYRGVNVFLLSAAGYSSPYWLTFKQALDLGGNVRKGQKSTPIIFWKILEKDDAEAPGGKARLPLLRYFSGFNLEQCEGIEAPADAQPATPTHEFSPIETAARIAAGMPKAPALTHNEARAYYRPITDTVNMPKPELFGAAAEYYSTLFHELTHATGHAARLGRPGITELAAFGSAVYSREELVAEMGAAFLSAEAGILHRIADNSAAYLANWIRALKGDNKLAVIAAAQAQKAADFILGRLETEEATA